jgi:hypothetical protein
MPLLAKTLLRRSAAVLATAVALLGAAGISTASADVTYSSYTWTGDVVQITGPGENITGGSGQIQLHENNGSTILAWCIDIYDWLQNSGTYSVTPNGPINGVSNPAEGGHIGALMLEGNTLIAANKSMTIGGYTFSAADQSAAIQLAIWTAEYGTNNKGQNNFTYNLSIMPDGNGFANLVTALDLAATQSGPVSYDTLDPDPANCTGGQTRDCTDPTNQHLGFVSSTTTTNNSDPVPGPIVGAGLPGLVAACAALIVLGRRRRVAVASRL